MRHSKKMIMIPEAEYNALLGLMMKQGNELDNEKAMLNFKISNVLSDKKMTPEIKHKKYNILFKQRRQLRDIIENKPQKVIIESTTQSPLNVAPYLGLDKFEPKPKLEQKLDFETEEEEKIPQDEFEETIRSRRTSRSNQKSTSGADYTSASDNGGPSAVYLTPTRKGELLRYISKNLDQFNVQSDGTILSYRGPIKGSNFTQAIDFMTGKIDSPPKGYKFFESALRRDPITAKIINMPQTGQKGKGKTMPKKLVLVNVGKKKIIKTPGLERIKMQKVQFKPQLWEKL